MTSAPRWTADIRPVREVALHGAADLAYWRSRLAPEGLSPAADSGGRARLRVMAAELRFMRRVFRELSLAVEVVDSSGAPGAFLVGAFSTSRLFALAERRLFGAPYAYGDVRISLSPAMGMSLDSATDGQLTATMAPEHAVAGEADVDEAWQGPVHLPSAGRGPARHFVARLEGRRRRWPFAAGQDTLVIQPGSGRGALRALADSGFTPDMWTACADARHARSKTVHTKMTTAIR